MRALRHLLPAFRKTSPTVGTVLFSLLYCTVAFGRYPPQPDLTLSAALQATPNEQRGQRLFDMACGQCHGRDAFGSTDGRTPALAGQQYEYLVKQLVDFVEFERAGDAMHGVLAQHGMRNAQAIADIVGYVANLAMNPTPVRGTGAERELGRKIFESGCVSCHGRTAEGNPDLWVPNLRGQHYPYLVEEMRQMAATQRRNVSEDLHRVFTTYSAEELQAVADHLARWSAAP